MGAARSRHPTAPRGALAVLAASLAAASAAFALPPGVTKLKGTSRGLPVALSYSASTRSVNGFAVEYTCRGKKPQTDSDVHTIAGGADHGRPLARVAANKRLRTSLAGRITRFTEDGPRRIGRGRLTLDARVYRSATKRVIRGTMRVHAKTCPSARRMRLRVIGPR